MFCHYLTFSVGKALTVFPLGRDFPRGIFLARVVLSFLDVHWHDWSWQAEIDDPYKMATKSPKKTAAQRMSEIVEEINNLPPASFKALQGEVEKLSTAAKRKPRPPGRAK